MRSTYSLFQGIYSASLAGILPYSLIGCFVRWDMSHSVTSLLTAHLMSGQQKCRQIVASVLSSPG